MNRSTLLVSSNVVRSVLLVCVVFLSLFGSPLVAEDSAADSLQSERDGLAVFQVRFEQQIFPLLSRGDGEDSCVGCHRANKRTQLHYYPDAASNFHFLLAEGYFDSEDSDSLLGRVSSKRKRRRMPPSDLPGWSEKEVAVLAAFCADLETKLSGAGFEGRSVVAIDERFPAELLAPYGVPRREGLDNSFITCRQLRGKFATLFPDDDGQRGEVDLFAENMSLLGGADFVTLFDEKARATPAFLTALDTLATAFSEEAYRSHRGLFAGRSRVALPPPVEEATSEAHRREITRLFEAILFRAPREDEIARAYRLVRRIYLAHHRSVGPERSIGLRLRVEDRARDFASAREFRIPIEALRNGLVQEHVDQTRDGGTSIVGHVLEGEHRFLRGGKEQFVRIRNEGTHGRVSFAGLRLSAADPQDPLELEWSADDTRVEVSGAWKAVSVSGRVTWDDEGLGKGASEIVIPIDVPATARYRVEVLFRKNPRNARQVLVEVSSPGEHRLAHRKPPPVPPPGEAHYFVDQSEDTRAFVDLGADFQFGGKDHVEYSNRGTHSRVTADAVRFVERGTGKSFHIDNHEAEGRGGWKPFKASSFGAYNRVGPDTYHDENKRKGELFLRYHPSLRKGEWNEETFYRVQAGFPAKRDHERRTPVTVHARASTPIIQIVYPATTRIGAEVVLDASSTYSLDRPSLHFHWEQIDGPPVELEVDQHGQIARFVTPELDVDELAWVGLARALIAHPDFLFTRPLSLARASSELEKERLRLVKLALDLLGRSPTAAETERLASGTSLATFREEFLQSAEFETFYYHRIRLYLESRGTPAQDEPVRLWCHVAFNDRPIQEILTADYTVDEAFETRPRPAHHGRSGVLTTAGFIEGKPGLPSYNYAAQVAEKFLGYVFEITPEIEAERTAATALSTTEQGTSCYSCHRILTPLAHQRLRWTDSGDYRRTDEDGAEIDDSDQNLVKNYAFKGQGMEAFALAASRKERFVRTLVGLHFIFLFGREMRVREDERVLYKEVWDRLEAEGFTVRAILRALLESPEYLDGRPRADGLAGTEKR